MAGRDRRHRGDRAPTGGVRGRRLAELESRRSTFTAIAAPTGAEERAAGVARASGLAARRASAQRDGAGNLIWRFGAGGPPELLVMAHVDTVFAAETPAADRASTADDLVGPGVGDNAAAVIAAGVGPRDDRGRSRMGWRSRSRSARRAWATSVARFTPAPSCVRRWRWRSRATGSTTWSTSTSGACARGSTVTGPGGHSWWDRGTPSAVHALVEIAAELAASGANIGPDRRRRRCQRDRVGGRDAGRAPVAATRTTCRASAGGWTGCRWRLRSSSAVRSSGGGAPASSPRTIR